MSYQISLIVSQYSCLQTDRQTGTTRRCLLACRSALPYNSLDTPRSLDISLNIIFLPNQFSSVRRGRSFFHLAQYVWSDLTWFPIIKPDGRGYCVRQAGRQGGTLRIALDTILAVKFGLPPAIEERIEWICVSNNLKRVATITCSSNCFKLKCNDEHENINEAWGKRVCARVSEVSFRGVRIYIYSRSEWVSEWKWSLSELATWRKMMLMMSGEGAGKMESTDWPTDWLTDRLTDSEVRRRVGLNSANAHSYRTDHSFIQIILIWLILYSFISESVRVPKLSTHSLSRHWNTRHSYHSSLISSHLTSLPVRVSVQLREFP